MIDKKNTILIGKAIREGKYLSITYKNKSGGIIPFWMSILDINAKDELRVNMFNITKDDPIAHAKIFISEIQSAEILRFSYYEVPEELINRLEHDKSLQIYDFHRYDNNILNYYVECYKANRDPGHRYLRAEYFSSFLSKVSLTRGFVEGPVVGTIRVGSFKTIESIDNLLT